MERREKREVEVTVGYTCDICHRSCAGDRNNPGDGDEEFAVLSAQWGYWSRDKDMTWHECHMCEDCFEKVKHFIEQELKGTVRTGELGQETRLVNRRPT
jgi:hypothetical protein